MELLFGAVTGFLFGIFLQKGQALRYEKQIGFLRFMDMTIIKFMFSAVLVGMIGITLCHDMGLIDYKIKALSLGGQIVGGSLFGIGWALFGYCPGTAIGALGEGRWHVLWGVLGMLFGAGVYAEVYPLMKKTVLSWGTFGKLTIPEMLGVNHWIVIAIMSVMILALFKVINSKFKNN